MILHHTLIDFEKGFLFLLKNKTGLQRITYVKNQGLIKPILHQYKKADIQLIPDAKAFKMEAELFRHYFQGEPVDFSSLRLDFSEGTPFQGKVWKATQKIPFGRLETYKSLALKINHKGYRSVGGALGKNPFLIAVPCHRVIRTNGDLGGFGAGLDLKKYLLRLEGISL